MPENLRRNLCRQFAMGAALGALLATCLSAGDAYIFRVINSGASPELTATVVASCFAVYCGIGAALSGFLMLVTDNRGA